MAIMEAVNWATQAFPNVAPNLLQQIISTYPGVIVGGAVGLAVTCIRPVWEYIYDWLFRDNPARIDITASYKKIPNETTAEDRARLVEKPPNGYSANDKQVIEKILENARDQRPKAELKIYDKKGTLDDAKAELKKLGDASNPEEKEQNKVWVKELSNGKTVIVRVESTDENADATLEVQTTVNTTDGRKVTIPIIKVRYYK